MSDLFGGFRPTAPPPELRARVLAAAREAAGRPSPGLLELLLADRALRVCFGVVAVLMLAHLFIGGTPHLTAPPLPLPSAPASEAAVPSDEGLTAAEQIDDLEPAL